MKLKKIERFFRKIPLFVAKHVFEFSLLALFLSFAMGAIIFYKYSILAERMDLDDLPKTCPLEEKTYQKVLDTWAKDKQIFDQADFKNYRDIFSTELESIID